MPIKKWFPTRAWLLSDKAFWEMVKMQIIVGNSTYHRRKYRGLSQSQLAEKAKVTQTIISELENGDYNPSIEILSKISSALHVKLEFLTKEQCNWKFFEAMDYFVSKIPDIDVLKAMKLSYFSDLESKMLLGYKLLGIEYFRRHAWPFNRDIYLMDDFFEKKDTASRKFKQQSNFKSFVALTDEDRHFLDGIIKKYGSLSSAEIRDRSYNTPPMQWCTKTNNHKMGEIVF